MINKQKGFSLLEILVAFSIMAISLGILLKIFSSGVNTAIIAEEYTVATQIAESLMAKTGIEEPLIAGETYGTEVEKYRWSIKLEKASGSEINGVQLNQLMTVQVIVEWDGGGSNKRVIELKTIKIGQQQ